MAQIMVGELDEDTGNTTKETDTKNGGYLASASSMFVKVRCRSYLWAISHRKPVVQVV